MKRTKLTETFMTISNLKKHLSTWIIQKYFSVVGLSPRDVSKYHFTSPKTVLHLLQLRVWNFYYVKLEPDNWRKYSYVGLRILQSYIKYRLLDHIISIHIYRPKSSSVKGLLYL